MINMSVTRNYKIWKTRILCSHISIENWTGEKSKAYQLALPPEPVDAATKRKASQLSVKRNSYKGDWA